MLVESSRQGANLDGLERMSGSTVLKGYGIGMTIQQRASFNLRPTGRDFIAWASIVMCRAAHLSSI
jgi:hypothetical protein